MNFFDKSSEQAKKFAENRDVSSILSVMVDKDWESAQLRSTLDRLMSSYRIRKRLRLLVVNSTLIQKGFREGLRFATQNVINQNGKRTAKVAANRKDS